MNTKTAKTARQRDRKTVISFTTALSLYRSIILPHYRTTALSLCRSIALTLLLISSTAWALPQNGAEAVARITKAQGNIRILKPGMESAPAKLEQPVSEGDILVTETDSKAEITFADRSVIRLAPESKIEITKYLLENGQRKSGVLKLFTGKMRAIVSKAVQVAGVSFSDGQNFQVRTPTAVAGVKGTDFFVFYIDGITGVVVNQGLVDTYNISLPGHVVSVSAGSSAFINPNEPPNPPQPSAAIEVTRLTNDTDMPEDKNNGTSPPAAVSYSIVEVNCE